MVQVIYNQSLLKNIGQYSNKELIRKPFNNWYVSPLDLNNHQYYLFTEVDSHLPIITNEINSDQFQDVLDVVIEHFDFLCEDQKEWLTEDCCGNFTFSLTNKVPLNLTKIVQKIEQSPTIFLSKTLDLFKRNVKNRSNPVALGLISSTLMLNFQEYFSLDLFEDVINWHYPVETKKPARSVRYWYLDAKFDYPTKWKRYENKSLTEYPKVVNQIRDNNKEIVKEYINYLKKEDRLYSPRYIEKFLLNFLNNFLLRHRINLVTSNLAEAVVYLYLDLINGADDPNLDHTILINFYRFLTYTGCIRKSDADKLDFDLDQTLYKVCLGGDLLDVGEDNGKVNIESDFQNTTDLKNTHQKKKENNNNLLSLAKGSVEDKTIFDKNIVFEINAKVVKAKPVIYRTFKIGGLTSFKDLQKALVMMFGLSDQKIYNLYNPRTKNTYSSVSEMEILELKSKDQLKFNYNDGQYLFNISVKKRTHLSETTPMQIYPQVISGKGNINQAQDNKLNAKVDINSINEKLQVKFINKLY